jgi:ACS family tartrate transporter-like MFS transporter
MLLFSHHSDKTGERRWHITIASLVCAFGLFLTVGANSLEIGIVALIIVGIGVGGSMPVFWGTVTQLL